ncbi:MAG: response regulator [Longimicrobiales bacterium]
MVEDDADDRVIYGTILAQSGFEVVFAEDYESGLRAAREQQPDAVLLDIGLPGSKTGLDLCLDVRRGHETAHLPVVVLSGFAADRVGAAARAAGCSMYIEKPTSPLQVAREIERLLTS